MTLGFLRRPVVAIGAALLLTVGLLGAGRLFLYKPAPPGIQLTEIESVGDLQRRFNDDTGAPRLVLVVSPT